MFKLKSSTICILSLCTALSVQAQYNTTPANTSPSSAPTTMPMTTPMTTTTTTTTTTASKDMTPPSPLQNKLFDSMVGEWTGISDMMGKKARDRIRISWILNHQFIKLELLATGVDQPKMKYEGLGIFGIGNDGKVKNWWFDSWGADNMATGTGDITDNTLTMTSSNSMFNETRTFEVKGNTMTMHAKGSMTMNGQQTPYDLTTIYKRR